MKKVTLAVAIFFVSQWANAQSFLTDEEILNTMPGTTIMSLAFSDGKTEVKQVIGQPEEGKTKGKISGDFGGESYTSKWFVTTETI